MDNETYKSLLVGPMYDAILKKKLARKDGREGNFVIACSTGRLKYMNALADQGSDVNIMLLLVYNKLTRKKPIWTNIRLTLANRSYVYPLGIAEDVLVDVDGFVYPVEFVILDIKEDDYMPLILGTPFLATAKVKFKCNKGSMTLKAGKFKVRFVRTSRNRGKAIVNSPQPIYDQEPSMVAENDETSKDKEIDKLIALISLSFKKIYKPTNNNLRTSSNTSQANQDNSLRINRKHW
nr:hypothetical protein [Tanacetum cinerariifolium]GEY90024.1 hypothetical protein [Tanacetum cinerariifolium]